VARDGTIDTLSMVEDGASLGERRVPYLFLVMEARSPSAPPLRIALDGLDVVAIGRGAERRVEVTGQPGTRLLMLRLADPWLSANHASFMRRPGERWIVRDAGSKNGTFLLGHRITEAEIDDGAVIELGHTFFVLRTGLPEVPGAPGPACTAAETIAGKRADGAARVEVPTLSPAFAAKLAELSRVARSAVPVVLEGETGTGKEVIARALHRASGRSGDFVAVNCGALPPTLVEAELFGAKKGAFSGATEDRPGLVRAASGGTLLLDEIGELPAPAQVALLRVLQEREVLPIGATRPVPVDVRFVAATHRPLDRLVEAGAFRRDLRMRLAGYRLYLPPLRERLEDLGLLVAALLGRQEPTLLPALSPRAVRALFRFGWPGNVRQLERALSAAAALAAGAAIGPEHLPEEVRAALEDVPGVRDDDDAVQREEIMALLREHRGNVSAVARATGKARMQVQRWLKRFQLDPEAFR
jgi:hypothetical protein